MGLKMAIETDRSTAPSSVSTQISGQGGPWWGGGRWFDVITDGFPGIQNRQAVIFPMGHAGKRTKNMQPPVVGRKWSDGDIKAPAVADFLGLLMYAALGGLSTNMVPANGSTASLLNNEPIGSNPKSFVLGTQPDQGGNILRFDIKGQNGGGTISISGIDAYGNGASELISFASTGLAYSRTSWSSIAASGLAISGLSAASVTVFGIRRFEHRFFTASCAPSVAVERIGTPTAGNSASKSHMHLGMMMKELTLENPSDEEDGILSVSADWEGDPTATCTGTSINAASPLRIWPAWTLAVKRDGGTNWYVVKNAAITIGAGNRTYRSSAGAQGPQGKFSGPVEITGALDLILDNEVEYNRWLGASRIVGHFRWNTDWRLNAACSQNYELSASLPLYIETAEESDDDDQFSLSADIRTSFDADLDIAQFILINGTPGAAYGNSVI